MLACIACSTKDGGEGGHRSATATPNSGKSLTSQVHVLMCILILLQYSVHK
jgi:hypothetical protein